MANSNVLLSFLRRTIEKKNLHLLGIGKYRTICTKRKQHAWQIIRFIFCMYLVDAIVNCMELKKTAGADTTHIK